MALCLIPSLTWGLIFESDKMEDALPHVQEETWVLIDADNTLIESEMHMGSPQWMKYMRMKIRSIGFDKETGEEALYKFWRFVQHFVPVRLVDPHAVEVIEQLASSNVVTVILTARDPVEMPHTERQMASVGISIPTILLPENTSMPFEGEVSLFENGVIYCGEHTKSQALRAFMQKMGKTPKKVILIDDKREQVHGLAKTMEEMGIEFVGIRFSRADERVRSFNPTIAEVQYCLLPRIVSDEEAEELLSTIN